jgi:radical SAM superfamily enzyme YgiQ (UPF0313 family)
MTTVYLADLTHTTVMVSNDAFPLNIGYIGAYIKKMYPDVRVELFKYPEALKAQIDKEVPDILGLSNYPWNLKLDISFMRYVKQRDKRVINVMGGPNIGHAADERLAFLLENGEFLDFYALFEGETSFLNLLDAALECGFDIERIKEQRLKNCIYLKDGELSEYEALGRKEDLSEFPSPYLSGVMDDFFDDLLSPMIETHRGCPFACTYCHEGHGSYNKVHKHSTERVTAELDYIGSRVGGNVKNLMIADPNFGMFPRDVVIAEKIGELQESVDYPGVVFATTAKNSKDNLIKIIRAFRANSMPIWMSVQSMTEAVLENIKRSNISVDDMLDVQRELGRGNTLTKSELILCLPGESFETHLKSLVSLIELGIDQIICYQLMLVNGSEMSADKSGRSEYSFETRFRVLPRSFSNIYGLERSIETEEIVVATRDLSFDDYLKARILHLLVAIFYNGKVFSGFFKLTVECELDMRGFIFKLLDEFRVSESIKSALDGFVSETRLELFDSEDTLSDYYSKDENFDKLLCGTAGANLLQKYSCMLYMENSKALIDIISKVALDMKSYDDSYRGKVVNLKKYYGLLFEEYLSPERREVFSKGLFKYNVSEWLASNKLLDDFAFSKEVELTFYTSEQQYELVESYFNRYGRDAQAFGKILTRIWMPDILRKQMP